MSERKVIHEVKLQKSVVIILGVLAFGVCANVFVPAFKVEDAMANFPDARYVTISGSLGCDYGCN